MIRLSSRALHALAALGLASLLALTGCATTAPTDPASPDAPSSTASSTPAAASTPAPVLVAEAAAPPEAASAPLADMAAHAPPAPRDPLEPEVVVDLDAKDARTDLWARVRKGFAMPDLTGPLVDSREQWYASRPDYVQRMTERGGRYLFHIVQEVERRGLPTELALLPFIESAFNPHAKSSAQASGMWQFIPSTGRAFDLTQNVFRDDRRNVLASTRAALDYLEKLHGMFGDWHLALAAYNWGEGRVQRAIERNRRAGLPTDYENLRMPRETRNYVPKLQAVKNIIAHPADFSITLPALENHPYFLSVPIDRDIDVALAAELAGLSIEEFAVLNPQMNTPVILAAGSSQVLLPYDNADRFVRRLASHPGPLATWTAWTAPKTMRPADVAKLVGMDEGRLRKVNHIPPRMLVRAGSTLLVPRHGKGQHDVSEEVAENARMMLAPEPRMRRHHASKRPVRHHASGKATRVASKAASRSGTKARKRVAGASAAKRPVQHGTAVASKASAREIGE